MPTHKLLPTSLVIALTLLMVNGGGYLGVGQATPATNTHQDKLLHLSQVATLDAQSDRTQALPIANLAIDAKPSHLLSQPGTNFNYQSLESLGKFPFSQNLVLTTGQNLSSPLVTWGQTPFTANLVTTTTDSSGGVTLALATQNYNVNADHTPVSEDLEDYGVSTIDNRVYSKNALTLYSEGFVPILSGTDLIYSRENHNGALSFRSPLVTITNGSGFMGTNVRSAIVDGQFNPQAIANVWEYTPTEINLSNISGYQAGYQKLAAGEEHGFVVGAIIAGSRKANNVGLTAFTRLYYAQINSSAQNLGQIYLNTYDQAHPVVINNSINIEHYESGGNTSAVEHITPTSGSKVSDSDLLSLVNYSKTSSVYASALAGLKALATRNDAPLIVFAAGNYGAGVNVATNSSVLNTIKSKYNSDQKLYDYVKDPNAGLEIEANTPLNHLLADQLVKQNLLVVSSNYFDPDYDYSYKQYKWKYDNLLDSNQQATAVRTGKLLSPQAYKQQLAQASQRSHANNQYVSAIGAYQCGVVKEHCLTVSYRVDYPEQFRPIAKHGFELGTSVSAPVVSAVAVMLKQQFPWFSAANLKETILTTATDVGKPGIDEVFGWGVLNANKALHGPAQFYFSDFKANLAYRDLSLSQVKAGTPDNFTQNKTTKFADAPKYIARNSYFTNDISGNYGLEVSGTKNDFLFLTGNNTYKGNTNVKSGNLVVVSPNVLHLVPYQPTDNYQYAAIASATTTIAQGASLYADYAHFKNLESHGRTALLHSTVDGNLTLATKENVYLSLPSTSVVNHKMVINDTPLVVTGTAKLSGNLVITDTNQIDPASGSFGQESIGDAYIPEYKADVTQVLLVANRIEGKFDKYDLATNSVFKTYQLDTKSNPKALSVKVSLKPRSQITKQALADSSISDRESLLVGNTYIDQLFDKAYLASYLRDNKNSAVSLTSGQAISLTSGQTALSLTSGQKALSLTSGTSPSTNAVSRNSYQITIWEATAGRIQNMNLNQYKDLLFRSAATIYADAKRAISQVGLSQVNGFGQLVTDRFMSTDHKLKTYLKTGYANAQWKHKAASVIGTQELTTQSFGLYKQSLTGVNTGFVINYNKGNWYEDSTFNNNYTALGVAKITNIGGIVTLGQGFDSSYYGITLFTNIQNYDLTRASLFSTFDQKANFRVYDSGLNIRYGILDSFDDTSGMVFSTGFNLLTHLQTKIAEQATGSQALYASAFSLNTPTNISAVTSVDLGTKYYNKFTLFGRENNLFLLFNVKLHLGHNDYNVHNLTFTSGSTFTNRMITDVKLDYNLKLNVHLSVNLSGNYTYALDTSSFAGNIGVTYSF